MLFVKKIQEQRVEQRLKEMFSSDSPPRDSSHMEPPNPDTIADTKKYLLNRILILLYVERLWRTVTNTDWMLVASY